MIPKYPRSANLRQPIMKYNKPIVKTNNVISQRELENGIWQFMLDHSIIYNKDLWRIVITTKNKEDFFRRVYARATGLYVVKDKDQIEKEIQKRIDYWEGLKRREEQRAEEGRRIQELKKRNIVRFRILIFLLRLKNKLIKKWC